FAADVPPAVVTVTSNAPARWEGATAEIVVGESTLNEAARVPPNTTAVAPIKFVPVIATFVPPAVEPTDGVMPVTDGADAWNVNLSVAFADEVPALVVMVTSTVAAAAAGLVARIVVADRTL